MPIMAINKNLSVFFKKGFNCVFAIVRNIGGPFVRIKVFQKLKKTGLSIFKAIDKSIIVSTNVKWGTGIFVGKDAIIDINSCIKDRMIINTGLIIEHGYLIGNFVPVFFGGGLLCGDIKVGDNTHIKANSRIKQRIIIGINIMIGMGSVILNNIKDDIITYSKYVRGN